jgi:hypothetical protein
MADKIPKKVIEMAKAIEDADKNAERIVIIQSRNWGKTAAYRLARMTEDIPHEVIEPKQLPDNNKD